MVLDRENAFLLYAQYAGDVLRTAEALKADPVTILRVADEEDWAARLEPIIKLRKSTSPAEVERGLNRITNFIQAYKMRMVIERQLSRLFSMSDDELMAWCMSEVVTTHKDGSTTTEKKLHTRPFADLASAMEKVHELTYLALNDTTPERNQRAKKDEVQGPSALDVHAEIAKAMAEIHASKTPRALVFDQQLGEAQRKATEIEAKAFPTPEDAK